MLFSSKISKAYGVIEEAANSNIFTQGISGVFGFPLTIVIDVGVIFTHYSPMINDIRKIYGLPELDLKAVRPVIEGCKDEIISDLVVDKFFGQIPFLGVPFNMVCAKAMTWRLGILFTMLAAGELEVNSENVKNIAVRINKLLPQKTMFSFYKPSVDVFEKLVNSVDKKKL